MNSGRIVCVCVCAEHFQKVAHLFASYRLRQAEPVLFLGFETLGNFARGRDFATVCNLDDGGPDNDTELPLCIIAPTGLVVQSM